MSDKTTIEQNGLPIAPSQFTILKISHFADKDHTLHVEIAAANKIVFDLEYTDYDRAILEVCQVAPYMRRVDVALTEFYDDAGRTKPDEVDMVKVGLFLRKHAGKITPDIADLFEFS